MHFVESATNTDGGGAVHIDAFPGGWVKAEYNGYTPAEFSVVPEIWFGNDVDCHGDVVTHYDPADDLTGSWLGGGTLARFTASGYTLFVLTAPETERVRLPRGLRQASILTLMPATAAQISPGQPSLLISPDPTYLLAER